MSNFKLPYPNNVMNDFRALNNWLKLCFNAIKLNYDLLEQVLNISAGDTNLTANMMAFFETPTPATDGVTTLFYTSYKYRPNTLAVYIDESLAHDVTETSPSGKSFTLGRVPDADEDLRVCYIKAV